MVAGFISKDSWSRCETPSPLYDTVRNPNAPYCPPKPIANVSNKDTIETTEQRLKREMIDRFQAKGLELPHETYVAVVQVGKYVFLAVMLPVYLGLYGIPHWFLVTALPQLFGMAGKFSMYCGRFAFALGKRVADLMKGMLEQLIGDALRLSKDRAKNFWKRLTAPWTASMKAMGHVARTISASVHKIREAIEQALQQFNSQVNHNVQITNRWIADNAIKVAHICGEYLKRSLHFMDQKILTPLILFCLPPFRLAVRAGRFIKTQAHLFTQACSRVWQEITDPIVERLRKGGLAVKKGIRTVIEPLFDWVLEKKEKVNALLEKMKKAVVEPVAAMMAFIKSKVPDVVLAGWSAVKPVFAGIPWVASGTMRFAWKMIPQKFKDNMDRQRQGMFSFGRALRSVGRGAVSGVMWILRGGNFVMQQLFKWALRCIHALRQWGKRLVAWLVVLPRKIKQASLVIFKVVAFVFARIAFAAHVVVLLVWLASINGFYLMRHVLRS